MVSPGLRRVLDDGTVVEPSVHANHWELFACCVALVQFPEVFRDRQVVMVSDSMSACRCIRGYTASLDSLVMAQLTRVLLSLVVELNCRIQPVHIPGVDNVLADCLSRGMWGKFSEHMLGWLGHASSFVSGLC